MAVCWNCLHPVEMHADDQGCLAGLYARAGSVLSMIGCSCALEPADACKSHPKSSSP